MSNSINRMATLRMAALGAMVFLAGTVMAETAAPTGDKTVNEIAPAAPGAEERMGQAYEFITRAEQAWQEKDVEKAKANYEDALDILDSLTTDYPGWYTQVVRHRILTCESAIEQMQNGKPAPAVPGEERSSTQLSSPSDEVVFPLSVESSETVMRALRAGIEERDITLVDLRAEILDLKDQIRKLAGKFAKIEGKEAPEGSPVALYPDVLKAEARQRIETGAYSNALALLDEMKTLFPDDPAVPGLLGVAYCRQGAFDEALRVLAPIVKRGQVSADVWLTLGVAYLGTGNLGRARNAFEKTLECDPAMTEANFNLSQVLIRLKPPRPDLARRHYMMALQQGSPRDPALESAINQSLLMEQARKLKR